MVADWSPLLPRFYFVLLLKQVSVIISTASMLFIWFTVRLVRAAKHNTFQQEGVFVCYNYTMSYKKQIHSIRENKALLSLLLSNSLVLISLGMLVPIYALFVQQVGGGALFAGLTAGALAFASAISALLTGRAIDKVDRNKTKYFLVIGWALISLSCLLYLIVHNVAVLFAVQIFAGFVKTISAPAFDTLYARHLDDGSTGQEYGIWESSFFITAGIGSVLGGLVVTQFGFNGVFIVMATLALLASGYIAFMKKGIL